ncbi:MAG TPA: high-potential iron-sulfur protein [Candidatus Thermoplasmatota archaeon]|nr:high-potential iron-sulfur protein [Candidatus Thermoplasmatota archaeon]
MDQAGAPLHCRDCRLWYGAENDEYGPCQIKQSRGDARFVTFGNHRCDEGMG